jgi:hypothetical protein
MNSGELTAEQIEVLQQKLQPAVQFAQALLARIEAQQFPWNDPLRLRTLFTLDQLEAMQQLLDRLAKERVTKDTYLMGCRSQRESKRQWRDRRNG